MLQVSDQEIDNRLREENPWWVAGAGIDRDYAEFPRRAYLPPFARLGNRLDTLVNSIGDAKNLQGGTLLFTPLKIRPALYSVPMEPLNRS